MARYMDLLLFSRAAECQSVCLTFAFGISFLQWDRFSSLAFFQRMSKCMDLLLFSRAAMSRWPSLEEKKQNHIYIYI